MGEAQWNSCIVHIIKYKMESVSVSAHSWLALKPFIYLSVKAEDGGYLAGLLELPWFSMTCLIIDTFQLRKMRANYFCSSGFSKFFIFQQFLSVLRSFPTPPTAINQSKFQISSMRIQSGKELCLFCITNVLISLKIPDV